MIVDLNITEYIRSLMKEEKNDLSKIEAEARVNHVPIVKPETKELLRTLVLLKKPMKILEVGAAVGFSSLYMNRYQPESGTIITIERNEKRIKKAKENIKNAKPGSLASKANMVSRYNSGQNAKDKTEESEK